MFTQFTDAYMHRRHEYIMHYNSFHLKSIIRSGAVLFRNSRVVPMGNETTKYLSQQKIYSRGDNKDIRTWDP